jgi:peroxiredoxin
MVRRFIAFVLMVAFLWNVPQAFAEGEGAALIGKQAPAFQDLVWLTAPPLQIDRLRGKVVLVRFWFSDCGYCAATAVGLNRLHKEFEGRDLVIIGIHHPKSAAAKSADYVRKAATDLGFRFPIALDNNWKTVNAFWLHEEKRQFTSASFLIDKQGKIAWVHEGGEYHPSDRPEHEKCNAEFVELRRKIIALLKKSNAS